MKIKAKGLEARNRCGLKISAESEAWTEVIMGRLPEAFSIMALEILSVLFFCFATNWMALMMLARGLTCQ